MAKRNSLMKKLRDGTFNKATHRTLKFHTKSLYQSEWVYYLLLQFLYAWNNEPAQREKLATEMIYI